ncbi:MAG: TRAP transporter substrate-binding protein DctP [Rhodospirillales bacterium]
MRVIGLGLIAGLALAWTAGTAAAQEAKLRVVSAFPKQLIFSQDLAKFVEAFNKSAEAKGVAQIQYVGGPEVTPVEGQGTAIKNGVFDLLLTPTAYTLGVIPEGDALLGSNVTPAQARANGGYAALNKIWNERLNANIVAWWAPGVGFHMYLNEMPKLNAKGQPDLAGVKIRSTPIYKEWLETMGATNVMMQAGEVYTALERKVVDGFCWPGVGAMDLGWHKFVKARISPPVWQLEVILLANKTKWDRLPQRAREVLSTAFLNYETEALQRYTQAGIDETEALRKAGVQIVDLKGDAGKEYVRNAYEITWKRVKERAPANADNLRKLLYVQN